MTTVDETTFRRGAKVECTACGASNDAMAWFCTSCRASIPDQLKVAEAARVAALPAPDRNTSSKRTTLAFCEVCGARPAIHVSFKEVHGWLIWRSVKRCR